MPVIVNHKYICGATAQYVVPGASKFKFDQDYERHIKECKECKAKLAPAKNVVKHPFLD